MGGLIEIRSHEAGVSPSEVVEIDEEDVGLGLIGDDTRDIEDKG